MTSMLDKHRPHPLRCLQTESGSRQNWRVFNWIYSIEPRGLCFGKYNQEKDLKYRPK
jgi:hypothetical protein